MASKQARWIARPGWGLAAGLALSAGGCALISGYDFGKYGETGGAGGGGGTTSTSSGTSSGSASGSSSSGATTGSSSSSGTASSSGATTTGSSSGATSSSSSTSSTSGGPILSGLLGPEAIAVDTTRVYFTTNNPPNGPSTASSVFKDGTSYKVGVPGAFGAPAVAAANSEGYAATWVVGAGNQQVGSITTYGPALPATLGTVMDSTLGVAVWGSTVFFTTLGSKAWTIPPGGSPANFTIASAEIASGPIAADAKGVYWTTETAHMLYADLGGVTVTVLCTVPDTVYAIATDPTYVYWTDQSGGVYQADKMHVGQPKTLSPPAGTPAYGIAVSQGDGTVYFAQGASVMRLQFPYGQAATAISNWLVNPRGVAYDNSNVYVAEKGTSNMSSPDGAIWKLAP